MTPLTLTEAADHVGYACRATVMIVACLVMGLLIGAFVGDSEVDE